MSDDYCLYCKVNLTKNKELVDRPGYCKICKAIALSLKGVDGFEVRIENGVSYLSWGGVDNFNLDGTMKQSKNQGQV
jgi:hypothetical protein